MLENAGGREWAAELFPSADEARLARVLPVGSRRREAAKRAAAGVLDAALDVSAAAARQGKRLDAADGAVPLRRVLVASVYGSDPQALIAALDQLRSSRHQVRLALGARGEPAAQLAADTVAEDLAGGKFANLNRVLASAPGGPSDWVLLLDDDVELPPRFLDRMIGVAEALDLDLAQPAQTRRSDPPWQVTRRRAGVARRTRFVEVGPVVLMRGAALDQLLPFSEAGMGWGLCLHWAALAERRGWRLGIVDALAVSHTRRPTASAYSTDDALAAAREFLAGHEHIDRRTAGQVIETYRRLPERAPAAQ